MVADSVAGWPLGLKLVFCHPGALSSALWAEYWAFGLHTNIFNYILVILHNELPVEMGHDRFKEEGHVINNRNLVCALVARVFRSYWRVGNPFVVGGSVDIVCVQPHHWSKQSLIK